MKKIGQYRITGVISKGNMGVVYRSRDPHIERDVAIKVMLDCLKTNTVLRERFQREAEALARLNHPNIVRVHNVGEDDKGNPYLVMDLVDGVNLQDHLDQVGPIEQRQAAEIVRSLALGLAHVHETKLLHRDVKPANVILSPDGTPMLTDFGLVKDLQASRSLTKTGRFIGSPGFMPPEQTRGEMDRVGPHSDVYGLGATLYALLSGKPPFTGSTVAEVLDAMKGTPDSLLRRHHYIDTRLDAICLKCLEDNPQARYPTATELAADLAKFLQNEKVEARRAAPIVNLRRWAGRRHPALWIGGTGVLVVGVVLAAGFFGGGDEGQPTPKPTVANQPPSEVPAETPGTVDPPPATEVPPNVKRAWDMAKAKAARGEHDTALEQYEFIRRELEGSPFAEKANEETVELLLSRALEDLDESRMRFKPAGLQDIERAIELAPNNAKAYLLRGRIKFERGDRWRRSIRHSPVETRSSRRLRMLFAEASQDLARAVELAPNDAQANYLMGRSQGELGKYDAALGFMDRAVELDSKNAQAYEHRARIRSKLGEDDGALEDLTRAEKILGESLEPDVIPLRCRVYLLRAELRCNLKDFKGASSDCKQVLELVEGTTWFGTKAQDLLARAEEGLGSE